jgi:hypothetical protein
MNDMERHWQLTLEDYSDAVNAAKQMSSKERLAALGCFELNEMTVAAVDPTLPAIVELAPEVQQMVLDDAVAEYLDRHALRRTIKAEHETNG